VTPTPETEMLRRQIKQHLATRQRLLNEIRGLQAAAIARRELHADIVSLREDMAEIKAAALAGNLRDVVRIVDDATARRERTREPRKVRENE
jgi:hypothetical protein